MLYVRKFYKIVEEGQDRGRDSTGIVALKQDKMIKIKEALPAEEFMEEHSEDLFNMLKLKWTVLLGNNRAQPLPEGDSIEEKNRQPIELKSSKVYNGTWIGTHNGTIGNDKALANKIGFERKTDIDSEIVLAAFDYELSRNLSYTSYTSLLKAMVQKVSSDIAGGFSFAVSNTYFPDYLALMKNFKPLWLAAEMGLDNKVEAIYFSSEKKNLMNSIENVWIGTGKKTDIHPFKTTRKYWEVPAYTGLVLKAESDHIEIKTFPIRSKHITNIPDVDSKKATVICSGGIDSSTAAFLEHLSTREKWSYCITTMARSPTLKK